MDDEFHFNGLVGGSSTRRDFLKFSGLSAGALALGPIINAPFAYAKDLYPSAKIRYIVNNPPGGGYDILGRAIAPYMTKYLQKLSPRAKGGGIVVRNEERKGYPILFNSKPDGYTIGIMDSTFYLDNLLLGEAEVDATKYTFLHYLSSGAKAVVTNNNKGFNSWQEAVEAQKKRIVKMGVGYFGRVNHICAIIANEKMGTKFKLIPFRGAAECMGALVRNDIDLAIGALDSTKSLIDAKEIKVLLSFTDRTDYPGAVTTKELGYPEMTEQVSAHRLQIAPPKLAAEPKRLLIEAMKKSCDDPGFIAWAKSANYTIHRVFGDDAVKFFMNLVKFYSDIKPTLKKHLT